jgi:hypothetical protein
MALAAYNFIRNVNITDNNIQALVVAANLLCLLGQNPQNTTLIANAKADALPYYSGYNSNYNYAYRAAYYAASAANYAAAANAAHAAANAANAAAYGAKTAYNAAANAAVNAAYAGNQNNLPSAYTCAAGLIYLNIYTLLTQTQ